MTLLGLLLPALASVALMAACEPMIVTVFEPLPLMAPVTTRAPSVASR